MFFFIALFASFGYAIQNVLMAYFYRRIDTLSAVAYRGLSLGLSMSVLLVFVPLTDFQNVPEFGGGILAASVCAALGNWAMANAFRHLSVGVANALCTCFAAIMTVINGFIFLKEVLSLYQILFIALILLGVLWLGASRTRGSVPEHFNIKLGILNSLLFGLFLGCAYVLIGFAARSMHPFLVGYLWEFTIGILAAFIAVFRGKINGRYLTKLSYKESVRLLLYSSPTAIGTGFYALAMRLGPIGIATAVLSTMMVFTTLLAYFVYHEKLTIRQWLLLFVVCGSVVALRMVSY